MSMTLDEALASLDGLDALDAVETLEQAGQVQRNVNLAQAELLKIGCHWADLNAVLDNPHAGCLPGTERLVRLGGEGTPEVDVKVYAARQIAQQTRPLTRPRPHWSMRRPPGTGKGSGWAATPTTDTRGSSSGPPDPTWSRSTR